MIVAADRATGVAHAARHEPLGLAVAVSLAIALALGSAPALAAVVPATPTDQVEVAYPTGAPALDVKITLQLTIDADGSVARADELTRDPPDAPASFLEAAAQALLRARFRPTTRDGRPVRSLLRYIVAFHPPAALSAAPAPHLASTNESDEDYTKEVLVQGARRASPRGLGDTRIKRELLEAAPHARAGELLSRAPGWFVDHEDSEGLANDVLVRGFDLEHGAGVEMKVGSVPFNVPLHVQGQGYADPSFIIPEVVRSVRVLSGPYDPRQGDAAIAGSAYFDLGVPHRGYRLRASYGSFDQTRVVAIAAPEGEDEETFAAFAVRQTHGFGAQRASRSGSAMGQVALDLGARDHLRVLGTAYGARSDLPGVVREDDVTAGRIGLAATYPRFTAGAGVQSARVIVGVDFDHLADNGGRFELAPWLMWSDFRARQNFAGNLETSRQNPALFGLGDMFETTTEETAAGFVARYHSAPLRVADWLDVVAEPGLMVRAAASEQTKSLLASPTLAPWDRRMNQHLRTLEAGAYLDVDARIGRILRVSGGVRADYLRMGIDDHLQRGGSNAAIGGATRADAGAPGARADAGGLVVSPRVTMELMLSPTVSPVFSWGEGFRSLDATTIRGASGHPYSKVRSVEGGLRLAALGGRYSSTVSAYSTFVGNELAFEASSGGLVTERASTRSGLVAQVLTDPFPWLLVSTALSVTSATFNTDLPGRAHNVPSVPPITFRTDASVRGAIGDLAGARVSARAGVGYTFLAGRHLTDAITGRASHIVNASTAFRRGILELGVEAYNLLALRYADEAQVYVSNWSADGSRAPASLATHLTAAPPRTVLVTASAEF